MRFQACSPAKRGQKLAVLILKVVKTMGVGHDLMVVVGRVVVV